MADEIPKMGLRNENYQFKLTGNLLGIVLRLTYFLGMAVVIQWRWFPVTALALRWWITWRRCLASPAFQSTLRWSTLTRILTTLMIWDRSCSGKQHTLQFARQMFSILHNSLKSIDWISSFDNYSRLWSSLYQCLLYFCLWKLFLDEYNIIYPSAIPTRIRIHDLLQGQKSLS